MEKSRTYLTLEMQNAANFELIVPDRQARIANWINSGSKQRNQRAASLDISDEETESLSSFTESNAITNT